MESKKTIFDQYANDIFAVANYGENKKIYIKEISEEKKLLDLLYKLDCQELSLTKKGVEFLMNYYGLDFVADMILEEIRKGVDFKYVEKEEIIEWLKISYE